MASARERAWNTSRWCATRRSRSPKVPWISGPPWMLPSAGRCSNRWPLPRGCRWTCRWRIFRASNSGCSLRAPVRSGSMSSGPEAGRAAARGLRFNSKASRPPARKLRGWSPACGVELMLSWAMCRAASAEGAGWPMSPAPSRSGAGRLKCGAGCRWADCSSSWNRSPSPTPSRKSPATCFANCDQEWRFWWTLAWSISTWPGRRAACLEVNCNAFAWRLRLAAA